MKNLKIKKEHLNFILINIKNKDLKSKCLQALEKGRISEKNYPTNRYVINFSDNEKRNNIR